MIVINARFLTQKITGVQRYAIEICNNIPNFINGHEVVYVSSKGVLLNKKLLLNKKIIQYGMFQGNIWEQIDLPFFLKKNENPLLINFSGIAPLFYKKKIFYLHDLIFKHSPETFSYFFQKAYNKLIPISAKYSLRLVCVSNHVKDDIKKYLKINNVDVVYAAQAPHFIDLNLKREKFILSVSSLDPRKNFKRVIEAYKKLDTDYKLIIVGSKSKSFSDIGLDDNMINDEIIFTGYIDDQELVKLYNQASLFIFASLFEGFGIPPLEAQACGCPCLLSNVASLPEVYRDSVEYCDPYSIDSIKDKLNLLINNEKRREELVEKGYKNIKRFSWQLSANKLKSIIESLS